MRNVLLVIFFISCILFMPETYSQDFSNKGKDFWLAYPAHIDGNGSRMALYISASQNTSGTVYAGGTAIPFTVTANQATVVQIFPASVPVINAQNEGVSVGKGIHIVAQSPVVVYAHILNAARSGSSLILPTNTLGREYIAASYASTNNASPNSSFTNTSAPGSQFEIVAVENATTVEIIPTVSDVANTRAAGVPFTITLNQGDVYQFRTTFNKDVTGTKIRSLAVPGVPCKPIAVFSGSSWTSFNCVNASGGDNLFQQLMPKSAWGKNYVTAPFANRPYDIFRVMVGDPSTRITLNGTVLPLSQLINNTYYEFTSTTGNVITADQPVVVIQYMVSQTCDSRNTPGCGNASNPACAFPGDPEMVTLNPIEQTVNDVTVVSARNNLTPPSTNITKHFFTVIMKADAAASLKIDGLSPAASFIPIGTSGYVYIQEDVTASTSANPSHRIQADSGFIALAYGMGQVESYGYNAGTNIKDLYQFVSIQNKYATVDFPASCINTPFKFSMTFPYQPTQIKWVFGGIFPDTTVDSPVADSTWMLNGRQLYRFSLPSFKTIGTLGTYPVKVIAQNPTPDGCGNEQEINFDLQILQRPTATFTTVTSGCLKDEVQFKEMVNGQGRTITKRIWDFGNGAASSVSAPLYKYPMSGTYTAAFSVITDVGCISDTARQIVKLSETPQVEFATRGALCAGNSIVFEDITAVKSDFPNVKWTWSFGDGSPAIVTSSKEPQQQTYANTGLYKASLQLETASGCTSAVYTRDITVHGKPKPEFELPETCVKDPFSLFQNKTTDYNGSVSGLTYLWNFGDASATPGNPNTSTATDPKHKYINTGNYSVQLTATSAAGCIESKTQIFAVNGAEPQSSFTINGGRSQCSNLPVSITNNSAVDRGGIIKLEIYWDVANDPTNKTVVDEPVAGATYTTNFKPFYTPVSKSITVRVRAYSGETCFDDFEDTFELNAWPEIKFDSLVAVCANEPAFKFNAGVSNITGSGIFSGAGVSADGTFTPSIGPGVYPVRYFFTGTNGCTDFKEQSIKVYSVPVIVLSNNKTVLEGGSILLDAKVTGNSVNYLWSPAIWLNNAGINQPLVTPQDDIKYTLEVKSADGCTATAGTNVKLLRTPAIPNVFTPNGDNINDTWVIPFLDTYVGATVEIYNRYGQLVYQSKGYTKPWDGTANGKPLPIGTYYFLINPRNGRKLMSGFVDIIR